jgi:hypothetical protein
MVHPSLAPFLRQILLPIRQAHRNVEEHGRQYLVPELPTGGVVCAAKKDRKMSKEQKPSVRVLLAQFKAVIAVRRDACVLLVDAPERVLETLHSMINDNDEYIILKDGKYNSDGRGETWCLGLPQEPGLYTVSVALVGEDFPSMKGRDNYGLKFVVQDAAEICKFPDEEMELDFEEYHLDGSPWRWHDKGARRIRAKEYRKLIHGVKSITYY